MSDLTHQIPGPDPGACPECGKWRKAGMLHECAERQAGERLSEQARLAVARIREGAETLQTGGGVWTLTAAECNDVLDYIDSLARQLAEAEQVIEETERDARWIVGQWPRLQEPTVNQVAKEMVERCVAALHPPDPPASPADEYARKALRPEEYRERNRRLYGTEEAPASPAEDQCGHGRHILTHDGKDCLCGEMGPRIERMKRRMEGT